jgi:hypothetical protein
MAETRWTWVGAGEAAVHDGHGLLDSASGRRDEAGWMRRGGRGLERWACGGKGRASPSMTDVDRVGRVKLAGWRGSCLRVLPSFEEWRGWCGNESRNGRGAGLQENRDVPVMDRRLN